MPSVDSAEVAGYRITRTLSTPRNQRRTRALRLPGSDDEMRTGAIPLPPRHPLLPPRPFIHVFDSSPLVIRQ